MLAERQTKANSKTGPRTVPGRIIPVPQTGISAQAQKAIAAPYSELIDWDLDPGTVQGWHDIVDKSARAAIPRLSQMREALQVTMQQRAFGGINCYVLTPKNVPAHHRDQVVLVAHGGGYVYLPGEAGTGEATMVAAIGGYRAISVDYRMPPDAPFPAAVDDMITVWRTILDEHDPRRVGITGTSAGGGLILAMMLRGKQLGLKLPGAMAPSSPWADLTETGDSYRTNEWADNVLVSYSGYLGRAARLYAGGHDMTDLLLSPINGDFTGLPPAMLTTGTRDLFLSNTVRTHRKLRRAEVIAELHVYEGLSHAQFAFDPAMPETQEVYTEIAGFFDRHLVA